MKLRYRNAALLSAALLAACGSDGTTDPGTTPALALASGSGQTGIVGEALADPVVVRVTEGGSPVAGTSVTWSVTAGGGSVAPTTSTTGSDGTASTAWTLGATEGSHLLEAAVSGATGSPVTFAATGEAAMAPANAAVSIGDNFFDPTSARVAAGGTVTWTWNGSVSHNVTFPTGPNSSTQAAGTFARTFAAAGSFDYQCTIHSGMQGTIVVE